MPRLFLKFTDVDGEPRRVAVDRDNFVIGRQSDCDLTINDNRLSRRHAAIDRFGDRFGIADLGSSNGTSVGGVRVADSAALADGAVVDLGGFTLRIEIESDAPPVQQPAASAKAEKQKSVASGGQSAASSIPTAVFIIAPLLAIALLVCGGGVLWFAGGGSADVRPTPTPYETPVDGGGGGDDDDSPTPKPSASATSSPAASPTPGGSVEPTPQVRNDGLKAIETSAAAFLQQIAVNDPSAFLKGSEIDLVAPKIAALKGSAALAENLKAARASAGEIKKLAEERGLKPQFLAAAALAQLGSTRGSPLETAKSMAPVFADLRVTLANNLADDNLMMVAAFDQGRAGKTKDLRNQLEALAKKNPSVSPREIRTIWFLKKQGKLTDAEFDFALRFLAIGTVAQNPSAFGVNAEKLTF